MSFCGRITLALAACIAPLCVAHVSSTKGYLFLEPGFDERGGRTKSSGGSEAYVPRSAPNAQAAIDADPASVGGMDYGDIGGRYLFAGRNSGGVKCAEEIVIGELEKWSGPCVLGMCGARVKHADISLDGAQCVGSGHLHIADAKKVMGSGKGADVVALVAMAADSSKRVCGDWTAEGMYQFYDDMPRYRAVLEDLGALPVGGLKNARAGDIFFPVISGGEDMETAADYCWYKNADKRTDVSGRQAKVEKEEDNGSCFAADAVVSLYGGETKRMEDLAVGDSVLCGDGSYSPVFMFTHQMRNGWSTFIEIRAGERRLALSPGHYIPLADGRLKAASTVRVGDVVTLASGASVAVEAVSEVVRRGLYNPQTLKGDIIVNGVLASTYTRAVSPEIAHSLLVPLRIIFNMLGLGVSAIKGIDGFAGVFVGAEVCPF